MTHIPIILTQHAEDAALLWQRRKRAVNAPHYSAMYLGRLDEQLEAHIDGLRVAGQAGLKEAIAAFEAIGEAGEAFTISTLAFGHKDASLVPVLIDLIKTDPTAYISPAASGIGWLHRSKLHGKVSPLLDSEDPVARALGIAACAVHRVDPGKRLAFFLKDTPEVRRRAVRLAGEMGRADLLPEIQALCDDPDAKTAYWANWSAVLLGDRGDPLQILLTAGTDHALRCALPAMGLTAGSQWLNSKMTTPDTIAMKITGYGILGDAGAVPWLIAQMTDPALAQIAGESYAMITGADLEEEDLDGDSPDDLPDAPNDDPSDDNVDLEENENLAWADAMLVDAHWQNVKGKFGPNGWFLGQPAGTDAYEHGLVTGYQRQRRLAAFWLAAGNPTTPLANWQVPVLGNRP